jgi:hypothetical protein
MTFTPVTAVKDLAAALERNELLDRAARARMLRGAALALFHAS